MENGIQYEIINKVTGASYLARLVSFGDEVVDVTTDEVGVVQFANPNKSGNLTNDEYVIRDADTKLAPNGVDVVEDVVPQEQVSETE